MENNVLKKLKRLSTYPPENWETVELWWRINKPITFYSWECPPRKISIDQNYGSFINFEVDLKKIVLGEKIDKYTEIPRINCCLKKEKWLVENLILANPQVRYIKLIADTNGLYLYPKSLKIMGAKKIRELSQEFKNELVKFSRKNINKKFPLFVLYTSLQKRFLTEYERFFNLVYRSFGQDLSSLLVNNEIIDYWRRRLSEHIGLKGKLTRDKKDLLKRIIASYVSEGMIFEILSQKKIFPNPVWLNLEEPPIAGKTTEILRSRYGLAEIPKIYLIDC